MYGLDGVGLAAPQVGKAMRLFVIDADPLKDVFPETAGFRERFSTHLFSRAAREEVMMEEGVLELPRSE